MEGQPEDDQKKDRERGEKAALNAIHECIVIDSGAEFQGRNMSRALRVAGALVLVVVAVAGCKRGEGMLPADEQAFTFVVYPGSQYLAQMTDLEKRAASAMKPSEPPPPIAVYDTDAPVETVATYYAKSYGYSGVAADATNNLSAAKPSAYYRTGDLSEAKQLASLLEKLGVKADLSKAEGPYRGAEIAAAPNRPRVTIQRPYFDFLKSQVVDRTIIVMAP